MAHMPVRPSPRDRLWSRSEIEGLIADGRKIFILDGNVIKADAWLPYHPGGSKAVLHMIGRDGTEEVRALHSAETLVYMQKFVIGRIAGRWKNFLPPIQGGVFRPLESITEDAEQLPVLQDFSSSSSTSTTASASPVFDAVDSIRKRGDAETSPVSPISSRSSSPTLSTTKSDALATITSNEIALDLLKYPSLDHGSQDAIVSKYRKLEQKIRAAGLYDCPYSSYAVECLRYTTLFALFATFLHYGHYVLSGACIGLFWHQLVFTAHDAGHMGITHSFHMDTSIGIIIADFLGGLSIGWWKRNHNVHHIVTNSPEHDPDIEHMPFFAITHRFFTSLRSTYYDRIMHFDAAARIAIKYQQWLYYPLLCFGRFNLYRLSWEYLLSSQPPSKGPAWWHRYLEIVGQIFFWYWYGYQTVYLRIPTAWDRFAFVMISHMITAPLHVQITLSHFAMSTSDLGVHESFPQKMLRTTMDVDCPQWLDFVHGGLQFQAVHHLFPRIPRHNLRKAQLYVREFCEEVKVPYVIYGFGRGNQEVISRLGDVARQARIFEECRQHAAKELLEGHDHQA